MITTMVVIAELLLGSNFLKEKNSCGCFLIFFKKSFWV